LLPEEDEEVALYSSAGYLFEGYVAVSSELIDQLSAMEDSLWALLSDVQKARKVIGGDF
jgi:hypothetical protein